MIPRCRSTWAIIVAITVPTACGTADDRSSHASSGLVATTSVWADITSNVACGEAVTAIIPAGADPHTFEPSLRDRELLQQADLVVANGGELEETLTDLLDTVSGETNVIEMTTAVELIDGDAADHDDAHEAGNPHVWHDPTRVAGALDLIASGLTGRDLDVIGACVDGYRAELERIDTEIDDLLAAIPPGLRVLVTNHHSLDYFADRYHFEVLGTVLPSTSSMAETNAASLEELADLIDERAVPAIFVDDFESDVDADALARRTGTQVVPLLTGSLSEEGPASTYVGMLRANAAAIAEALTP